jgi:hypothetical protein
MGLGRCHFTSVIAVDCGTSRDWATGLLGKASLGWVGLGLGSLASGERRVEGPRARAGCRTSRMTRGGGGGGGGGGEGGEARGGQAQMKAEKAAAVETARLTWLSEACRLSSLS